MKKMFVRSLWALFFSILFGIGAAAGAMGFLGAMKMLAEVLK
ncbi:sodium:solute symporter [Kluyvera ascorbata]|nr:sodium:solute symporter [Kluyvera ascorbata]